MKGHYEVTSFYTVCSNIKFLSKEILFSSFFLKILEDMSPFCGATDTPVLDFGDVCPGFQSQGGFLACVLPRIKKYFDLSL